MPEGYESVSTIITAREAKLLQEAAQATGRTIAEHIRQLITQDMARVRERSGIGYDRPYRFAITVGNQFNAFGAMLEHTRLTGGSFLGTGSATDVLDLNRCSVAHIVTPDDPTAPCNISYISCGDDWMVISVAPKRLGDRGVSVRFDRKSGIIQVSNDYRATTYIEAVAVDLYLKTV